jgi:hypothetical protein
MPTRKIKIGAKTVQLDARPDRLDLRDRAYAPPVTSLPPRWPQDAALRKFLPLYIKQGLVLDQKQDGACTGFGLAAAVNFLLWTQAVADGTHQQFAGVSPHMLYDLARFYDEWPGEDYEGSSCRGAMKGWNKHGSCDRALWTGSVHAAGAKAYRPAVNWAENALARPLGTYYRIDSGSVADMQAAISEIGAIYVSASVHAGWALGASPATALRKGHAGLPAIEYSGAEEAAGGHAFALVGYNERGFVVQNSWGVDWGAGGFAVLGYADWLDNGTDAWVAALGVPQVAHTLLPASRARRIGATLLSGDPRARAAPVATAAQPWSTEGAYEHALVAGNNGAIRIGRPDIGRAADLVDHLVLHNIGAWLKGDGAATQKLVIYAHGGLNSEDHSIRRIRVMGPYFKANGVYPLFYTWRTGIIDTLSSSLEDALGLASGRSFAADVASDARDRLIEAIAHNGKWAWAEIKANAARAAQSGGALAMLAATLGRLKHDHPALEIHLVGHSAGAFVHGHLLTLCHAGALPIASVTLYAPACPLDFTARHYQSRVDDGSIGADRFWLHQLSDVTERGDAIGPYGKSLLYLVSRGFEDLRKTPLAGLQRLLNRSANQRDDDVWKPADWPQVMAWRTWVAALPRQADGAVACEIVSDRIRVSATRTEAPTHGGFDNDIRILSRTINRVLGRSPSASLPVPVEDLEY